jgi:hypothetical protein
MDYRDLFRFKCGYEESYLGLIRDKLELLRFEVIINRHSIDYLYLF